MLGAEVFRLSDLVQNGSFWKQNTPTFRLRAEGMTLKSEEVTGEHAGRQTGSQDRGQRRLV